MTTLIHNDGLNVLRGMADESVDTAILCLWPDPPHEYLEELNRELWRVMRFNVIYETVGPREMSLLRYLNIARSFDLIIWEKIRGTNHVASRQRPIDVHEEILVVKKRQHYRPFFYYSKETRPASWHAAVVQQGEVIKPAYMQRANLDGSRLPRSVWVGPQDDVTRRQFNLPDNPQPLWLTEQLLYCYTPTLGSVLEIGMGSGTGAVASVRLGLDYTGVELNPRMIEAAGKRIAANGGEMITQEDQADYISRQVMLNRKRMAQFYAKDKEVA